MSNARPSMLLHLKAERVLENLQGTNVMDYIVHIEFDDAQVPPSGYQPGFGPPGAPVPPYASVNGYVDVDYSNSTVSGSIISTAPSGSFDFTNFFLSRSQNSYNVGAQPPGDINQHVLSFSYAGELPRQTLFIYLNSNRNLYATSDPQPVQSSEVVCFAEGTLIQTDRGGISVEILEVGERVTCISGEARPIKWIGHRDIDCRASPDLYPVRVSAHAFGESLPARDLTLSPGHPVLIGVDADGGGGHLVPIMCLVNGTTIERMPVENVTYWHIELDAHDILLAEGLPAESYLDWGDREFFTGGADHRLANPDFVVPGLPGRCRPVALDGPMVEAERRRLDAVFAARLTAAAAWPSAEDRLLDS